MTLIQARALRHMTQLQLAYACNLDPSTLSRIACGHMGTTRKTFLKICSVLEVDPAQIEGIVVKERTGRPRKVS